MAKKKKERLKSDYNTKHFVTYVYSKLHEKRGLNYPQISAIIRMYHELAREDFAKGDPFYFKEQLGNLRLWKEKREIYRNQKGELVNELPINYRETFKLWEEKPELRNKTYIRYTNKHSDGFVFTTSYQISKANFKFKNVYNFQFNDTLKKMLNKNIHEGEVDAFIKKY